MLGCAYGLCISSEIDLPELFSAPPGKDPDVVVKLGRVAKPALLAEYAIGPFSWATPTELVFEVPGVARYRMCDGRQIVIDPATDADERSVRLFLLGSGIAAILLQRGRFLLHGCAVAVGGGALIAVGYSGVGKSTLAEVLRRRGYAVFADDVVVIDDAGQVIPGIPRIKLWQDVAEELAMDVTSLPRVRPGLAKFEIDITASTPPSPLPARWIHALGIHHDQSVKVEPITGLAAFALLRRNSYRTRFADAMGLKAAHLRRAMEIAAMTRLSSVFRPGEGFAPDALADAILADVAR